MARQRYEVRALAALLDALDPVKAEPFHIETAREGREVYVYHRNGARTFTIVYPIFGTKSGDVDPRDTSSLIDRLSAGLYPHPYLKEEWRIKKGEARTDWLAATGKAW